MNILIHMKNKNNSLPVWINGFTAQNRASEIRSTQEVVMLRQRKHLRENYPFLCITFVMHKKGRNGGLVSLIKERLKHNWRLEKLLTL